jgi:hypothetical protein
MAIVLLIGADDARAQDATDVAGRLQTALASADSEAILAMSDDRLEIGILRTTQRYSRSQARYVLDAFFRDHPPIRVQQADHAGTSKGRFLSATYIPARGAGPYTVYMRLRATDAGWKLSELIVREEN